MSPTIRFRRARRDELGDLLAVQHQAFGRVSVELSIAPAHLPPLNETRSDLESLFDTGTIFMVASDEGRVVGAVRCTVADRTAHVGRLVVATSHIRQGVGLGLMKALEAGVPTVQRFELFTGAGAAPALALYSMLGYSPVRSEMTPAGELIWLSKVVRRA